MHGISQHVVDLCQSSETVTSALAAAPNESVDSVATKLFKKGVAEKAGVKHSQHKESSVHGDENDEYRDVLACGKFPYRPSDLFLKIYRDVLSTLEKSPLAGLVSPSLLGSSGVIPLSIVSVIPDIMRHYANLIVRAETEVFIATNYWEPSHSAGLIADALKELSRRTGTKSPGKKIVAKLMYDRGTPSQAIHNHALVPVEKWGEVHIPKPEEMPNVDLEVVNYHRPIVGTFHAKFMIVDRKIACLNSNNIQDRPNVEMMVHLEGPIVEGFYDMALLTWHNALKPQLPLLNKFPYYDEDQQYGFGEESPHLKYIDKDAAAEASRNLLHKQHSEADDSGQSGAFTGKFRRAVGGGTSEDRSTGHDDAIGAHPAMSIPPPSASQSSAHLNTQDGAKSGEVTGNANGTATKVIDPVAKAENPESYDTTNASENQTVMKEIHSEADKLQVPAAEKDASKDTSSRSSGSRVARISEHLNAGAQDTVGTAEDGDGLDDFNPHIMHAPHKPVPIAMVNRWPRGTPGHEDPHKVPQDIAWLGAFKYAQQKIFIQTPTFNATPVVEACVEACIRGIQVTLYLDLGFNDLGEMIPFQGGTNEENVSKMYKQLNEKGKADNLSIYWYTGKDQVKPMNAAEKKRNCHVKFCTVDDQVTIVGNGNQDTQSWFHSQEINVMVDSKDLAGEWYKGINANQSTLLYGKVDPKDGIWRDKEGNEIQASGVSSGGPLGRLKGLSGAVKRVRGTGGF